MMLIDFSNDVSDLFMVNGKIFNILILSKNQVFIIFAMIVSYLMNSNFHVIKLQFTSQDAIILHFVFLYIEHFSNLCPLNCLRASYQHDQVMIFYEHLEIFYCKHI